MENLKYVFLDLPKSPQSQWHCADKHPVQINTKSVKDTSKFLDTGMLLSLQCRCRTALTDHWPAFCFHPPWMLLMGWWLIEGHAAASCSPFLIWDFIILVSLHKISAAKVSLLKKRQRDLFLVSLAASLPETTVERLTVSGREIKLGDKKKKWEKGCTQNKKNMYCTATVCLYF